MLRRTDLTQVNVSSRELANLMPRATVDIPAALEAVTPLIHDVRERGAEALLDQAERFDGVRPENIRVPEEAISAALEGLDPAVRDALEIAIEHAQIAHTAQLPEERRTEIIPGGIVEQRWIPVRRVGLYVPGGLAVYPSSVVMNVVPAQVAGVPQLAVTSPAQKEFGGLPHPTILAACALLGVTEVYAAGGAGAVAMFAYGIRDGDSVVCEPVDVVTGPGNVYVAAAKRAVMGTVGIDSEAGTSEIAVLADSSANPTFVAHDLISQAEHDPAAASVLITDSSELIDAVDAELERLVPTMKHAERIATALTGPQSGALLVRDLDQAVDATNAYGAEHLEIQTKDADAVSRRIHNAGAIFLGDFSPVPLGDYMSGSNHVLPTGGTANFASGLGVQAFIKSVQVIDYDEPALAKLAGPLRALAVDEDLPAHADTVDARAGGAGSPA
ncbi:MAG TPA: histidinol dehydrogenase [Actinomycetaceae bacterium]|nr:histidinol dehydrogenase [Actinomycetaceae bacterium]